MSDQGTSSYVSGSVMNDLRLQGDFCDAVIKVQDVEFQIHKVILCECSPYFEALFKRWSTPEKTVFDISGLSPAMMQLIIEFAYTGSVNVTEGNVQELLLAADQFSVTDIVQACCNFLGEKLSPSNCIGIWHFTNICFLSKLQRKAYRYIIDHFEEVLAAEEFHLLSMQELTDILDRDDLNVTTESTVYKAVLQWIAHKYEERKTHFAVLLSKVRLALTTEEYIRQNVMSNELVRRNNQCMRMATEAIGCLHTNRADVHNPLRRPRLPTTILLATGGWGIGHPTNCMEAYNVRTNRWITVHSAEHPLAYHGTACLNGFIYVIGGLDGAQFYNTVHRFDLDTHTWHEAGPMHKCRCYVSVTVLGGCIYAMGGHDGVERLSTAERYRPETNQWTLIAAMHEQRSDASCTTLHNKVYICGGFNGNTCLNTCEYYNPETNHWTAITPMSTHRSGIGVVAYAGHIYAVGGFDGNNRLRSAEAYDPHSDTWHTVASMLTARSNFGIKVVENQLFAVGGYNGFSITPAVEYYNAETDEWTEACDLGNSRSALSCCVVPRLPNMINYVVPCDLLPLLHLEDRPPAYIESS